VGSFAIALWRLSLRTGDSSLRRQALLVMCLLCLQFLLGVLNIWWLLPLPNAVAHNFVAANLLAATILARVRLSTAVLPLASSVEVRSVSSGSLA
jgi:cytochrome c oxidase assembly protein subunit 15